MFVLVFTLGSSLFLLYFCNYILQWFMMVVSNHRFWSNKSTALESSTYLQHLLALETLTLLNNNKIKSFSITLSKKIPKQLAHPSLWNWPDPNIKMTSCCILTSLKPVILFPEIHLLKCFCSLLKQIKQSIPQWSILCSWPSVIGKQTSISILTT